MLYVLTVAIIMSIYGDFSFTYMMSHVLVEIYLVRMATDYSSGPLTPDGKQYLQLVVEC